MKQPTDLSDQIAKEEQRNLYLTEVLNSLSEQYEQTKLNLPHTNIPTAEQKAQRMARITSAQLHTLDTKIQVCKREIAQMRDTDTIYDEVRRIKEQIKANTHVRNELRKEVKALEISVEGMERKDYSKERNNILKGEFEEKSVHLKVLSSKLEKIKSIRENSNSNSGSNTNIPHNSRGTNANKKTHKSNKSSINIGTPQQLDKFAFYKNLVKFYTVQQQKLKEQIRLLKSI